MAFLILWVLCLSLLFGSIVVQEVTNTVDYYDKFVAFVFDANKLAKDFPVLAAKITTDIKAKEELEQRLSDMKENVKSINESTPPKKFEPFHQIIIKKTTGMDKSINYYLENINTEKIVKGSDIFKDLYELNKICEEIKNKL